MFLSRNGKPPGRRQRLDGSPIRNPSRMPFFTQAFTRQPVGEPASGSAARTALEERRREFLEGCEILLAVLVRLPLEKSFDLLL